MVDVLAINRSEACAILDDGTVIHFDKMFDVFGDETEDVGEAAAATAALADGTWVAIDLTCFESTAVH